MKLGIAMNFPDLSPREWGARHRELGMEAVAFPCSYKDKLETIDAYALAARENGLVIAEVGAWCNPMHPDESVRRESINLCTRQLELAEYVGARCCVNISGAVGPLWDAGYPENFSDETYAKVVETTQKIIDGVRPRRTRYSLEPMPNMFPDSPESYLDLARDISREGFGFHMDGVNMISSVRRYYKNAEFISHCFELLGDKILCCHVKDCVLEHKLTLSIAETQCGQGGFDIKHYISEAEKVNPDMPMLIEHLDCEDKYIKAIDYIRSL